MRRKSPWIIALLALVATLVPTPLPAAVEPPKPAVGSIVTVIGTGAVGFSKDGTRAKIASLSPAPHGPVFDPAGQLLFADTTNQRLRRVDPQGKLVTVAGNGKVGFSGDGGPATAASLNWPKQLTVDGAGNVFITDFFNFRIRKVDPQGIVTTVAGGGHKYSPQAEGGPAVEASFAELGALAADREGNLFFAENGYNRVWKVTPQGILIRVAGGGKPSDGIGDGGAATAARLFGPIGVAVDTLGNLYIAEFGSVDPRSGKPGSRVRKVSPDGIITTVAGTGTPGFSGDGGPATEAALSRPFTIAVDSAGNLFIGDWGNYRVRKVSPEGIITTVAGIGRSKPAAEGAQAAAAGLRGPFDLAVDPEGNLLIADTGFLRTDGREEYPRILKVLGVAAPGLLAGQPFPKP